MCYCSDFGNGLVDSVESRHSDWSSNVVEVSTEQYNVYTMLITYLVDLIEHTYRIHKPTAETCLLVWNRVRFECMTV